MKTSRIRKAMIVAAVSGAALASSLIIAEPAHATEVTWNCATMQTPNQQGNGFGDYCTHSGGGPGYGGAGYWQLNGVPKYMCSSFSYIPDGNPAGTFAVWANGCM